MSLDEARRALEDGRNAYRSHDNNAARKNFDRAISLLNNEPVSAQTNRLRSEAYLEIIDVLDTLGKWLPALEYAGILIRESMGRNDKRTELDARLVSCQIHLHRGNWDEAKKQYQIVLELAEKIGSKTGLAEAHYGLGYVDWRKGDINGSRFKVKKAMDLLAGDNDGMLACKARILLATIEDAAGNTEESIEHFKSAIASLLKHDPGEELARAYNNLGEVYKGIEDYASASEQYEQCVAVSEKVDSKRGYLYGLSNLAECYAFTGRTEEARDVLRKVEKILESAQEKYIAAQVPHATGLILYTEKRYREACEEFKKGIDGLKRIGNPPYDLGIFWFRYGLALKAAGDRDEATEAFQKAKKIFTEIKAKVYLEKLRAHL